VAGEPRTKLGKYDIVGILGKGAVGAVYDAYDSVIGRRVAVETVAKDSLQTEQASETLGRFRREAQVARRLDHPGVVAVYDCGETDDVAFIAMEYIKGKKLQRYFEESERFEKKISSV